MSLPDFGRRHSDWSIGWNGMFGQHEQPFVGRETKGFRDKERLREETTEGWESQDLDRTARSGQSGAQFTIVASKFSFKSDTLFYLFL